jgi:hypothetical protein
MATQAPLAEKVITREVEKVVVREAEKVVTVEVEKEVELEQPVAVAGTPPATSAALAGDKSAVPMPAAYRVERMIIKDAEMRLRVADTDRAIDQVTQVAIDSFGYILTTRTWYENEFKYATITLGVPVEEFEQALRRLRGLALQVLDENASGTDVTDMYVDLESRLRNLEATEARIREFLDKAKTVKEALEVNQELGKISGEIEEIKGKLNYLKERAAYSTITVHLAPEVPTPTITPTPTVTPTPTATPTPTLAPTLTPTPWRPGETLQGATDVLGNIWRTLVNLFIWVVVVLGPFAVLATLILWVGVRLWRLRQG